MFRFYQLIIGLLLIFYFLEKYNIIFCKDCVNPHNCKHDCYVLEDNKQLCLCNENEKGIDCKETWNVCEKDCNIYGMNESCSMALCKTGKCVPTSDKPYYKCECGDFFKGKNCEIENNPCSFPETNPCLNGTCIFIMKLNRIICKCNNGWTQKNMQSATMLNWGNEKVEVPPPCDEQIRKGLSKYVIYHTPVTYAMWWIIYIISVLVLFLCCCNVCFEFFSNSLLSYFSVFKGTKKD
ncbi:putative EGF-like membrane protein [Plasmodium gaboni]|uniref:EGF-like membrane protein,putative n=1 Tax=Plasmodium gaboni TaxID=647221 RepID=A0A151LRV4_9APIC|nr:putative EGF-like membrane protein [Plasmodium gaboni]KYO01926.1 putative EGF-like membrane protein [Plasmodium gaboni]SOV12406.1 EGF-like membrane protein,putative [Plasmodium gaboni]